MGCHVCIKCMDAEVLALFRVLYGAMAGNRKPSIWKADLTYVAGCREHGYFAEKSGLEIAASDDIGEFLFMFEQELVVAVQLKRPDLYFLHSAILEYRGEAVALIAPSGSGKSTTAWALLHKGFRYISDEMCAIDLAVMTLTGFAHALSLKRRPPEPFSLPKATLRTSRGYHVPVDALPAVAPVRAIRLGAIFYVRYDRQAQAPECVPVGKAESCARLYANALNVLAHPGSGLDAAIRITQAVDSYSLVTCGLGESCERVIDTLAGKVR